MDHTRDNPLKRFTAFWIAILLVFCFGVALILLRPVTHLESDSIMDVIGEERLEVKRTIDVGQGEALNREALQKALQDKLQAFEQDTVRKGAMAVPAAAPAAQEGADDATDAGADEASGESEPGGTGETAETDEPAAETE